MSVELARSALRAALPRSGPHDVPLTQPKEVLKVYTMVAVKKEP